MNLDTDQWESDYTSVRRQSLEMIIEDEDRITAHLAQIARLGEADRRNGPSS